MVSFGPYGCILYCFNLASTPQEGIKGIKIAQYNIRLFVDIHLKYTVMANQYKVWFGGPYKRWLNEHIPANSE